MLQQIDDIPISSGSSGSTTTSNPDTQILATSTTTNAIMYTVPANRKAVVYIGHRYGHANRPVYITNGSVNVAHYGGLGAEPSSYKERELNSFTLLAGTSIKNNESSGSTGYVFGVESDA